MEPSTNLESRVVRAAEAALTRQKYVNLIDVLTGMSLLSPNHVANWRKGGEPYLDVLIQGSPQKISNAIAIFRRWAGEKGLTATEARYAREGREGTVDLKFTQAGEPEIEQLFRTHYISPAWSEKEKQKLDRTLNKPKERVVFLVARDTNCSECGAEIESGDFLTMEADQPLCLSCAGLGDLEFLPAGDAALTRRATKYSPRAVVVVEFSRSRGRYERQGILVEVPAIERAEQDCAADAEERARERDKSATRRRAQDKKLVIEMTDRLRQLFPGCPEDEARRIAEWTAKRGSGRVGRSEAGRKLDDRALTLAVAASIRHNHTNYDSLLAAGAERSTARAQVKDTVDEILDQWSAHTPSRRSSTV